MAIPGLTTSPSGGRSPHSIARHGTPAFLVVTFVAALVGGCASDGWGNPATSESPAEVTAIASTVMAHLVGNGQLPRVSRPVLDNPTPLPPAADAGKPSFTMDGEYIQVLGELGPADRSSVVRNLAERGLHPVSIEDPRIDNKPYRVFDKLSGRHAMVYGIDGLHVVGTNARVFAGKWWAGDAAIGYLFELSRKYGRWEIRRISINSIS
jgi:hypothetical protein